MINQEEDVESLSIEKDEEKFGVVDLFSELKIRKEEGRNSGDQKLGFKNKVKNDETRVCHLCFRKFTSGKALGGHMRIHKDEFLPKKTKPIIMKKSKETCIVCGKEFPSIKSLFGHMRCHPDRDWRGVCPPSASAPAVIDSGKKTVDLRQPLVGWAVTGKRGRKAVSKAEDDELRDIGVYYLMMLARGMNIDQSQSSSKSVVATCNGDQSEGNNNLKGVVIEKKRKKVKLSDLRQSVDQTVVDNDKYKCSTCDKSFPTHQALGGHRSSGHKSPRVVLSTSTIDTETSRACCKLLDLDLDLNQEPPEADEEEAS